MPQLVIGIIALIWGIKYLLYTLSYQSTDDAFIEAHVAAISPRVSGHVSKIHVDDNQLVKAGDLLVELDPNDYQAKFDSEKAALEGAEAAAKKTQVDLKRYQQLVETDSATKQRLDYASADAQTADAKVAEETSQT